MQTLDISDEIAARVVGTISIPARPEIIAAIAAERARPQSSLRRVADLVAVDVGLSAALLRTVNSPHFGLCAKATTVHEAATILGMRNVAQLVAGLALRRAFGSGGAVVERFWDVSLATATAAATLAQMLPGVPRDDAWTLAMFHDCGIPVLALWFPDYAQTLAEAAAAGEPLVAAEDRRHGTTHPVVGYLLARNWQLPDTIARAILLHHDDDAIGGDVVPAAVATLIAVVRIAEFAADAGAAGRGDPATVAPQALAHLGIAEDELDALIDDLRARLRG